MATAPRMIFCFGNNRRAMQVARDAGWESGVRSDHTIHDNARPLALLDVDYKKPDWGRHLEVARRERPWLSAVPDVMTAEGLPAALCQAEELAPYCNAVMLIPKADELIERIPDRIGGKQVILGYSVPTSYGGTGVMYFEFIGRPVHLLGGCPRKQRHIARYLNVVSADGNMASKVSRRGLFYSARGVTGQSIEETDGVKWHDDKGMQYEALRRSLVNLLTFWGIP